MIIIVQQSLNFAYKDTFRIFLDIIIKIRHTKAINVMGDLSNPHLYSIICLYLVGMDITFPYAISKPVSLVVKMGYFS
jgi:hypothetical protein